MIYVIMGPTCSGKTSSALALAEFFNAPIINADAFQVYKDMNIGTAKISQTHPLYKRHYLLDIITPETNFNVKEYQALFRKTLDELLKENKNVIVVGGTGLYIKASLYDYVFNDEANEIDESVYDDFSNEELYQKLLNIDEEAAKKTHPNNRKRVMRALSMIANSSRTKTEMIEAQNKELVYPKSEVRFLFINPNRESLYNNINLRVDEMFKNDALIEEVKSLLAKFDLSITAKQGIGYKEVIDYLENKLSKEECMELIKKRTRNYAKRQVTFFKNQFEYEEFISSDSLVEEIKNV